MNIYCKIVSFKSVPAVKIYRNILFPLNGGNKKTIYKYFALYTNENYNIS